MIYRASSYVMRGREAAAPGFWAERYVVAIALVVVAALIRLLFLQALGTSVAFITFYPAVMLAALHGGFRTGFLATLLSALVADYFLIEPQHSFAISRSEDWLAMTVFVINCTFLSWVAERLRQTDDKLRQLEAGQRDELERQVAERTARLREAESDLNRAQAMALIGSWRFEVRGNAFLWSDETYRMFDVARETMPTYELFLAAAHPDDRARLEKSWQSALQDGAPLDIEHRIVVVGAVKWVHERVELEYDEDGALLSVFGTCKDITERKHAEESRQLLIGELNHRVKNTLAVVKLIAQQTFKSGEVGDAPRQSFEGRLAALGAAHDLVSRTNWEKASLAEVVHDAVAFCAPACDQIEAHGPLVMLSARQALAITMALHELSTNALKHGSLSTPSGSVDLSWRLADDDRWLEIVWREKDGPAVRFPERRSFGSMMIEKALPYELGGEAALSFDPEGVLCVIKAPILHEG